MLDNEAARAVADVAHGKHRRMLAVLEAAAQRNGRSPGALKVVVPTVVRVEAQLDRRAASTAELGRLQVVDVPLDSARADRAAQLNASVEASAVDASVAEVAADEAGVGAVVTIYTSDTADLLRLTTAAGISGIDVRRV